MNHEKAVWGEKQLEKFSKTKIFICGAGALGANITESLARLCNDPTIIDFDKVSQDNLATQPYGTAYIGRSKVLSLAAICYKFGSKLKTINERLDKNNIDYIISSSSPDLILDCFDNTESRQLVKDFADKIKIPTLHLGMYKTFGEINWNEKYNVPEQPKEDLCDYPLSRSLVMCMAGLGTQAILSFVCEDKRIGYYVNINSEHPEIRIVK